jgi:GntR family transcriptional regulator
MFPDKFAPHVPIYRQIIEAFQRSIARGELKTGDRAPAVRDLALRLVVNPNTVQRAYQELEREGLFVTRRGLGTFVEATAADASRLRDQLASAAARDYLVEMTALGFTRQQAERFISALPREKPAPRGGGLP